MMTIDEAIAHEREVAKDKRADADWKWRHGRLNADDCISCAEEHEQLAEWLEELKELREMKETIECNAEVLEQQGYNKVLDDFVNACKEDILCQTFGLHQNGIEHIAEQLKAGGNYE